MPCCAILTSVVPVRDIRGQSEVDVRMPVSAISDFAIR